MHLKDNAPRLLLLGVMFVMAVILLAPGVSMAGGFQKAFGGAKDDYGLSVEQTADGGYIMAGWTVSMGHGARDIYLVKTDSKGMPEWQKTIGGLLSEEGNSVVQCTDGGFVVAGTSSSFGTGPSDIYLVKTNSEGTVLWQRTHGGEGSEAGQEVINTTDGGYAVVGTASSMGQGPGRIVLVKTDPEGELQWQSTLGVGQGYSVVQASDGGYVVTGFTVAEGEFVYMAKTDKDGVVAWEKSIAEGKGFAVGLASDGGFVVAGVTPPGENSVDAYLLKTDAEGNLVWEKTFGGKGYDEVSAVRQTRDGGYVIAGWTDSSGAGYADVYLIKTDKDGSEQWTSITGGKRDDEMYSIDVTSDGGYVMGGFTMSSGAGLFDAYLVKKDKSGN